MQFLNDNFIYWRKKSVQTYLALREIDLPPPVKSWKNHD